MKSLRKLILPFLAVCLLAFFAATQISAATISYETLTNLSGANFVVSTDKDPASYTVGETMKFTIELKKGNDFVSVPTFSYSVRGEDGNSFSGTADGTSGKFTLETRMSCPGFVRVTVKALDEDGTEINSSVCFNGGAVADLEKIETQMAEPDDFDEYWEKCLAELDTVAPSIYRIEKTSESDSNYDVYDLYINCVGSKNFLNTAAQGEEANGATYASGKLVVPKTLTAGETKLHLMFQGAGVYTSPGVVKRANTVTLSVYAHSIELSREESYYKELEKGLLSNYMRRKLYNDNADESYVKYMILRDVQAVRFLKTFFGESGGSAGTVNGVDTSGWKGLWDGKTISLYGQSQGGFQCIAVAALDHDISLCEPWVPCWCDMYANKYMPSRFTLSLVYEHYSQKYFDSVSLGKRITCKTNVYTGFGDDTCPTPGVICMYNALTCEKNLRIYQGMAHNCNTSYPNNKYSERSENFRVPFGENVEFDSAVKSFDSTYFEHVNDTTLKAVKLGTSVVTFTDASKADLTVKVEPATLNFVVALATDSVEGKDDIVNGIKEGFRLRKAESAAVLCTGDVTKFSSFVSSYDADIAAGNYVAGETYVFIIDDGLVSSVTRSSLASSYNGIAELVGAKATAFISAGVTYASQVAYNMQLDKTANPNFYVTANNESGKTKTEIGKKAVWNLFSILDGNMPYSDDISYTLYDAISGSRIDLVSTCEKDQKIAPMVVPSPLYAIKDGVYFGIEGSADSMEDYVYNATGNHSITVGVQKYNIFSDVSSKGTEEGYSWILTSDNILYIVSDGDISSDSYAYATYASFITEINILSGAKTIASGAFANMTALKTIRLPYSLTSVASDAFGGFTSVTLYGYENNAPTMALAALDGVTFNSLGACGDAGAGLTWNYKDGTLTISGTGTTVSSGCSGYNTGSKSSWYAYYNNITKVVLPESVTTISAYCFTQMNNLVTLEITGNLNKIESGAFQNCKKLKTIYIAGNTPVDGTLDLSCVTSLPGGYQFDGGTSATSVKLSNSLTGSFGEKFISYNSTLTEITIPAGVTSLSSRVFYDCTALKTLRVLGTGTAFNGNNFGSTSLTKIYGHAGSPANTFADVNGIAFEDLTGDKYDGEVTLRGSCGTDVYFKLVETAEGADTYTIYFYGTGKTIDASERPWSAYSSKITKAVFRGSIEAVGTDTLTGLSALASFELDGSAIKTLNANEFSGLTGLSETLVIPTSITEIKANAFNNCTSIKAISVESETTVIDDGAFVGCTNLATVYGRPSSPANTFATNNSLTFVDFNDYASVATGKIQYNNVIDVTWSYDKAKKTLTITSNKTDGVWNETGAINYAADGKGWSAYKTEIEKVIVGEGLKKLSNNAFEGHAALKTIELSSSVYAIQLYALSGCTSLDTIYVKGNIPISGVADLHNITSYSEDIIFSSCAFDTVILNSSLTSIDNKVFDKVTLSKVIGTSEYAKTFAEAKGATYCCGYVNDNTVWYVVGDTLYVTSNGTVKAIDAFSTIASTVKKIEFTEKCEMSGIADNAFSAFTSLESALFECDAPTNVGNTIFGTQGSSFAVYYGENASGFAKPVWRGYPCAEKGSSVNIMASGECKAGGYSWSIDYDGTLTISGSGNGTLEYTNEVSWSGDSSKNHPWYDYRSDVKKIVIEESTGITKLSPYAFAYHSNLETVIIPSTLTSLDNFNIFCSAPKLSTITVWGKDTGAGVIDLRNITSVNGQVFEGSFGSTTPKIYLGKTTVFGASKFAKDCSSVTFYVYPYTTPETTIKALVEKQSSDSASAEVAKNISISYYSADDPDMKITGSQEITCGYVDYVIDLTTLTLTLKPGAGASGWNEMLYNQNSSVLAAMKAEWSDKIKHIVIETGFSKIQSNSKENFFSGWSALESIWFKNTSMEIQNGNGGLFADDPKLTTICWGSKFVSGTADLSGWNKCSGNAPKDIFKNCTSITSVVFAKGENTFNIFDGMFCGCTSLSELTIPTTVVSIGSGAFDGCTALKKITLEGTPTVVSTSFPSRSDLTIYCSSADSRDAIKTAVGDTETKIVFVEAVSGAIKLEGYKVRISSYNGLRSIFKLDKSRVTELEESGMTLKECGIIFAAAENKGSTSLVLSESEYVTTHEKVIKREVYKNGALVGNILSETDDEIEFAGTVINISEKNYKSDIYFSAYEIYTDENGVDQIVYTDYADNDYKTVSIYDICLGSYKTGAINAENDTEGIVWGILNSCAAELTADVDYKSVDGLTDLDGNAIGNSFTFKDVPVCTQSLNGGVLAFAKTNATISLFCDSATGKYTAVYHGSGSVPTTSIYGTGYVSQLSASFASAIRSITSVENARPNPTLKSSVVIDTIVLDHGITKVESEGISNISGLETVIYARSLTEISSGAFQGESALKVVALANGENTVIESGLADISSVATINTHYLFNTCKALVKIHLPSDIGNTIGTQFAQNCTALKGIWCGDGSYTEGVADFTTSATPITTVKSASLKGLSNITEIKLNNTEENVTCASDAISEGTSITYNS